MKINWINALVATIIAALLAWWLWSMGFDTTQKWLLAGLGGAIIEIGLVGGMAIGFEHPRSGAQVRLVMLSIATVTFIACCVYSFFYFSPQAFCIPIGVYALLSLLVAFRIYRTEM